MARIRGLKPDFFTDEDLTCLPFEARLFFQGLWCHADKAGRLEDRPKYLKVQIFPFDNVDVEKIIQLLANPCLPDRPQKCFIRRYIVGGRKYIDIPEFLKHQAPHHTEKISALPEYNGEITVMERLNNGEITEPVDNSNNGEITVTEREESVQIQDRDTVQKEHILNLPQVPRAREAPVDNPETVDNSKKAAPLKNQEKQEEKSELQAAVNEIVVRFPRFPLNTFLGNHTNGHQQAIIHVLKSLLVNGDGVDKLKMLAWCEAAYRIEEGKYNARDTEHEHEVRKRPVKGELESFGNIMRRIAAKGGENERGP